MAAEGGKANWPWYGVILFFWCLVTVCIIGSIIIGSSRPGPPEGIAIGPYSFSARSADGRQVSIEFELTLVCHPGFFDVSSERIYEEGHSDAVSAHVAGASQDFMTRTAEEEITEAALNELLRDALPSFNSCMALEGQMVGPQYFKDIVVSGFRKEVVDE